MEESLYPLLDHLAQNNHQSATTWQDWQIDRIGGGYNNLLYHATSSVGDFAIKFTIRDERDRAGREYGTLSALQRTNPSLAPKPILLERHRYAQPVVVQSWLNGVVMNAPPHSDAEWEELLNYYLLIHTITPDTIKITLPPSYLDIRSVKMGKEAVQKQVDCIPNAMQPATLTGLISRFRRKFNFEWGSTTISLCRADSNYLNFIQSVDGLKSVDWEYSGWSDPAYEVAEMMAHAAYINVPSSRWEWMIDTYCKQTEKPDMMERIRIYYQIMLVWWAARMARSLYETPLNLDQRLADQPSIDMAEWQRKAQVQYEHYVDLAEANL